MGTSGYAYDDWKGPFYPADLRPADYLPFYARYFPFAELNSTYYRPPSPFMMRQLARKAPQHFRMAVKAFSGITHDRSRLEDAVSFRRALAPLEEAGKLACVLLQFPYSFRPDPAHREYLRRVVEVFQGLPVAVEFRHAAWVADEATFQLLQELGAGFVCVDEPRLAGLVPPVVRATGPVGYVRFHGRNAAKWWRHEQPYERYDYLYSESELREWVPRIRELAEQTRDTFVAMNNHYQAKAVINARMLQQLLGLQEAAGFRPDPGTGPDTPATAGRVHP
ncbi:MAG TPA: DUF72 domain-containing protein [Limnochordales bacterium]